MKHAGSSLVSVDLKEISATDELCLVIADNGKGFDLKNTDNQGNGLKNFAKRMAEVDGTANIESQIGKGTKLTFKILTSRSEEDRT